MAEKEKYQKIIANNKKAGFNYFIEEKFEAGIVLTGSEVKSLRSSKANIIDAFAQIDGEQIYLNNCNIAKYGNANRWNHEPTRPRKLLLKKKQILKLIGKIQTKGYTLVPTKLYFNEKNLVKVEIALAKGKKLYDKRQTEKDRDWERKKHQIE